MIKLVVNVDKTKCIYCGGCVSVCPVNALTLREVAIYCDEKCTNCEICVKFCPVGALSIKK